jgi:c-di-GMP-binding flagellar brake protein YcgR
MTVNITESPVGKGAEGRRHTRHQLIDDLTITTENGLPLHGTSFEISAGGMSAATVRKLRVGEHVHLSPVVGERVKAVVRRNRGAMYGFEFTELPEHLRERITARCGGLPLFRTISDM